MPQFAHLVFLPDTPAGLARLSRPSRPPAPAPIRRPDRVAESGLDEATGEFFAWLCSRSNLRASKYRPSMFRRRTGACLRSLRVDSVAEARAALERDPRRVDRALDSVLIGVSSFFRDPQVFQAIEAVLESFAGSDAPIHAMSVGCSDGCELYSFAILLAERGMLGRARLVGVDCRREAVNAARRGVFADARLDAVPPERRRHFIPDGRSRRVAEPLAAACRWRVEDALAVHSPEPLDFLFCRNLAIYLNPEATAELWAHLATLVRPGGFLVVGKAERPSVPGLVRVGPCLFKKAGARR